MTQKLKMGMVGGGRDAFIGAVHRMAARLDGRIELVAGAFSSDPAKSKASGEDLGLDPSRVYPDYKTMAAAESKLPEGERIDSYPLSHTEPRALPCSQSVFGSRVSCGLRQTHDVRFGRSQSVARVGKVDRQRVCVDS